MIRRMHFAIDSNDAAVHRSTIRPSGALSDAGVGRFDYIRDAQAPAQVAGQTQPVDRQHLFETFQETRHCRRRVDEIGPSCWGYAVQPLLPA